MTRDFFMVDDMVDCVVGPRFLPNQMGHPVTVRKGGTVVGFDQYGKIDVRWPSGEVYGYAPSLLRMRA